MNKLDTGCAITFRQLQKFLWISGVDDSMANIVEFTIKVWLFQAFRTENTSSWSEPHVVGLRICVLGLELPQIQSLNSLRIGSLKHSGVLSLWLDKQQSCQEHTSCFHLSSRKEEWHKIMPHSVRWRFINNEKYIQTEVIHIYTGPK